MRELAGRGTVLDVCPTSNLRTGVVRSLDEHPLPQLRRIGEKAMTGANFSQAQASYQETLPERSREPLERPDGEASFWKGLIRRPLQSEQGWSQASRRG